MNISLRFHIDPTFLTSSFSINSAKWRIIKSIKQNDLVFLTERKVKNLNNDILKSRRNKIIAAVCSVTVLAGGSARIYAYSSSSKAEPTEEVKEEEASAEKDDGIISAGGTVASSQLSDESGLKNTSVKLTVEEVLAESGDSVTAGTQIYKLTDDSVEKAKKTPSPSKRQRQRPTR